ncbi:hypothetical protein APSETT445_003573 [Aspergillus pseudonomiae]
MAYNSLNVKNKAVGAGSSLRITPTNSPGLRPPRTPNKAPQHQATLSLQTVIGTTTTSPHGFSSHDQSKSFALCAGSAAILAELDEAGNVNQRFFRARPSASSVHPVTPFYHQSTPPTTPDTRARPSSGVKSTAHSAILNGSPANELAERWEFDMSKSGDCQKLDQHRLPRLVTTWNAPLARLVLLRERCLEETVYWVL